MRILALIFNLAILTPVLIAQKIEGVVRDPLGRPVERAQVLETHSGMSVHTDSNGRFELDLGSTPGEGSVLNVTVNHPTHRTFSLELPPVTHRGLIISLEPHEMFNEEVVVTAGYTVRARAPAGAATAVLSTEERIEPLGKVSDVVVAVPGVALNSQGGHFQNFSIRGVSRQRVMAAISGVRLTTERRAGSSASFIDPFLVQGLEVLRGPSSSFHGSGALGGVIQVVPKRFTQPEARALWLSTGNERTLGFGWGDGRLSVGAAARKAGNAQAPAGQELNSHFTQYSGLFSNVWTAGSLRYELEVLPAYASDIGKSNSDYPEEVTSYPRERHLIARFAVLSVGEWELSSFFHSQDLATEARQDELLNEVFNTSFDFGFKAQKGFVLNSDTSLWVETDYFGRRNVDARELEFDLSSGSVSEAFTLQNGEENEFGLSTSVARNFAALELEGGARLSLLGQSNAETGSSGYSAWNAFLGGTFPITANVELAGSLGTGLRFPSLSERFFSGTTGRGEVIANSSLTSERSLNWETGVKWYSSQLYGSFYYFQNGIADYIERVELEPDQFTFVNLTDGTIKGIEWELVATPFSGWQLFARGHAITGTDDGGNPLADIPVDRLVLGFWHHTGPWRLSSEFQYRSAKEEPGSGERRIDPVRLLSASAAYDLSEQTRLILAMNNILNREFFETADRKAAPAPGRSLSLGIDWALD